MSKRCYLAKGKEIIEQPIKLETLSERIRDDVVSFIEENRHQPFFLYMGMPQTHSKIFCSKQFLNSSKRGKYVVKNWCSSVGTCVGTRLNLKFILQG